MLNQNKLILTFVMLVQASSALLAMDKKHDTKLDALHKKNGTDIYKKIGTTLLERMERLAYRNRIALLPAILDGGGLNIKLGCTALLNECKKCYDTYRTNHKLTNPHGHKFILNAAYFDGSKNDKDLWIYSSKSNDDLLDITSPNRLIGHSLTQGQFGVIGWSDGATQFIISEADKALLNNLSEEQMQWIVNLYDTNKVNQKYSYEDFRIYVSLNRRIQKNIMYYYRFSDNCFEFDSHRVEEFLCECAPEFPITETIMALTKLDQYDKPLSKKIVWFAGIIKKMAALQATKEQIQWVASLCNRSYYECPLDEEQIFNSIDPTIRRSLRSYLSLTFFDPTKQRSYFSLSWGHFASFTLGAAAILSGMWWYKKL